MFFLLIFFVHGIVGQRNEHPRTLLGAAQPFDQPDNTLVPELTRNTPLTEQDLKFIEDGKEMIKEYKDVRDSSVWKFLQEVDGVTIYGTNRTTPEGEQQLVYKAETTSIYPPEMFYVAVSIRTLDIPKWNPIVKNSSFVRLINPRAKIVYQKLQPEAAIPLKPREFLVLTYSEVKPVNNRFSYIMTFKDVDYSGPSVPINTDPETKRAKVGINGVQATRRPDDPSTTDITWIATLDFNYPEIRKELVDIYQQFNIVIYTQSLKDHVEKECKKHKSQCGTVKGN